MTVDRTTNTTPTGMLSTYRSDMCNYLKYIGEIQVADMYLAKTTNALLDASQWLNKARMPSVHSRLDETRFPYETWHTISPYKFSFVLIGKPDAARMGLSAAVVRNGSGQCN